jgi:hypothetical protein
VTAVTFLAEIAAFDLLEGDFAQRCDAVIALLAVNGDMLVACLPDVLHRKGIVDALDLLKTKNVGFFFLQQFLDEIYS